MKKAYKAPVILILTLICVLMFSSQCFAATSYINQNARYTGEGCALNVRLNRTNKWSAGIYNTSYENNITWNSTVSVGDTLYIDAFTSYNGGKLWVYENGVCVRTIDAGEQQHIYLDWTVTTTNLKFACSASVYAVNGEQLSVTINAIGDSQAPTVTCSPSYVALNKTSSNYLVTNSDSKATLTMTDNVGVKAYYVSQNSAQPTPTDANWVTVTSATTVTREYLPTDPGMYYVYAKDAVNNISLVASFEAGYIPVVPKPEDLVCKEGEQVTFLGAPSNGTAPFTYQWYRSSEDDSYSSTATPLSGKTASSCTITTTESDNDKYFICEVRNRFGYSRSAPAHLCVYFPHVLGSITGGTISEGGHLDITVPITKQGNTRLYKYQWYKASANGAEGTRVIGADGTFEDRDSGATYRITTLDNFNQFYYCEISNVTSFDLDGIVLYTRKTNYVRVTADVTKPILTFGDILPDNTEYINKDASITVKLNVNDSGQGYVENGNNLTESSFQIYVNNVVQNQARCVPTLVNNVGNNHNYTLAISGVTGEGKLKIVAIDGACHDEFGNLSARTELPTNITVDNTKPTISLQALVSGPNDIYMNKEKTVEIKLMITDNRGIEPGELTADDIVVKTGTTVCNTCVKRLEYEGKNGTNNYIYKLTLSNVEGNGVLRINLPANKFKDWANNGNQDTEFSVTLSDSREVLVDNVAPVISSITTELDSFGSGRIYPTALYGWHDNWANQDIFVTINATDDKKIDYYMTSKDNGTTYTTLPETPLGKEQLIDEYNQNIFYRVVDMAGNTATQSVNIKIDRTAPLYTKVGIYELRDEGAEYVYRSDAPSNKTLYVKALSRDDKGSIQSGIEEYAIGDDGTDSLTIGGEKYGTYYTITRYNNINKAEVLDTWEYTIGQHAEPLSDDGYYEVQTTTVDNAGNVTKSPLIPIYINKRADNTIRISNMLDVGSGLKLLTINVYKGDEGAVTKNSDGIVINGEKAVKTINVNNPYKEYSTTVRLGQGTFYVEAVLYDNVGLFTVYHKVITNTI